MNPDETFREEEEFDFVRRCMQDQKHWLFSCASDRREEIWTAMTNVLVGEKIPIKAMIASNRIEFFSPFTGARADISLRIFRKDLLPKRVVRRMLDVVGIGDVDVGQFDWISLDDGDEAFGDATEEFIAALANGAIGFVEPEDN